ncbi:transglycosylase SLT domain-containing protein [Actinomycetospora endophytica]|uniref:Transglycosylase SLT domain-containing protein n=1 Tax=Actinomycetospora endophytica TaxID=2291215 RepID=A0ABS8P3U8_9PSEU|nr:transglycosylase SLT domain-containing protein [Actinomycetospora endophytica]MCD2192923.1 transglycosylase SLT domain-containing protein [Actinomycetospora endophytica]
MAGWGYDVVGALESTPGTEALLAIADRVDRVDAAAVTDLGRRFAALADGMDDSMRAVSGGGDDVGRAWQGPGADAFTRYTAEFSRAGAGTGDAARAAQRELADLGQTLQALRDEVAGHVSDALDAAHSRGGALGSPSVAEVRAAVAEPTARAQDALDRAEAEVAVSARRLRALSGAMTGWSRLRSPDAGVSSASGASSRWSDRQQATVGADEPVQSARITGSGDDDGSGQGHDGGSAVESTGSEAGSGGTHSGATHSGHSGDDSHDGDSSSTSHGGDTSTDGGGGHSASGTSETSSSGPGGGPPGKVGDWIRQATAILAEHGVPADKMDQDDIAKIIDHESGGDPDATNGWDSNAAKGTPSQGLMQTIGPTFDANKLPGHGEIRDPIDNIIAGVRYAIKRYGSVSNVPGVEALARGDSYVGY